MIIRKAVKKDIPEIKRMLKSLFSTWDKIDIMDKIDEEWFISKKSDKLLMKRINSKKELMIVAEEDKGKENNRKEKELIGYIFGIVETREAFKDRNVGLIDEIYIKPEFRKSGAGKALADSMLDWFRKLNLKWSIVLTHSKDEGANSYWQHIGYTDYNRKYRISLVNNKGD